MGRDIVRHRSSSRRLVYSPVFCSGIMASAPFDAEDLMRRSFFSSIMGLKPSKKPKNDKTTIPVVPSLSLFREVLPSLDEAHLLEVVADCTLINDGERSRDEIFREIVCECAAIEFRNTMAIPPETMEPCNNCHCAAKKEAEQNPRLKPIKTEQTTSLPSLEEFMKLLLSAVKESRGPKLKKSPTESPEEILLRKRIQNNEAALRYRKRQRDARMEANAEYEELIERNRQLKRTVTGMQNEIDRLKESILTRQKSTSIQY